MRPLGSVLMVGGAALGVGVGLAMLGGFHFASLTWIAAAGLAKLTLLASGGLMGAGQSVTGLLDVTSNVRRYSMGRDANQRTGLGGCCI